MTPAPSVASAPNHPVKYFIALAFATVAMLYLSAYFFLLLLKLPPFEASPLTVPRYAYYYWERPAVRSRLSRICCTTTA